MTRRSSTLVWALVLVVPFFLGGCPDGDEHAHGDEHEHEHDHEAEHAHGAGHDDEAGHAHEAGHDDEAGHDHEAGHDDEAGHDHEADHDEAHDHEGEPDHEDAPAHAHPPGTAGHDDHAHLDAKVVGQLDLAFAEIRPQPFRSEIKIPGTIRLDPDRQVILSAPLTCRVLKLEAAPHATVRAGQRVAWLEVVDPEVRQQQIRAVQVRADLLAARTERDRTGAYLHALAAQGSAVAEERRRVQADLRVLDARVQSAKSSLAAVLASLRVAGLSGAQVKELERSGQVVTRVGLYAPSLPGKPDLEVAARPAKLGQTMAAGERLFELAALDRLQVRGEAFESDLPAVRRAAREGSPVSLLFPAEQRRVDGLKILSVEGALDGKERITHFFLWLPNHAVSEKMSDGQRYLDYEFRAGGRVQILVSTSGASERFILPAGAVIHEAGKMWVYRLHEGGLDPVSIRAEQRDERRVIVPLDAGLHTGDRIVMRGALQAHLAMEQAQHPGAARNAHAGHNH